jgi:hypothetical protein
MKQIINSNSTKITNKTRLLINKHQTTLKDSNYGFQLLILMKLI